jgi:hypothetical protein
MLSWFYRLIHRTMHGTYNTEIRVETLNRYFNLVMSNDVLGSQRIFYPLRGQIKSVCLQLTVIKPVRLRVESLKGLLSRYKLSSQPLPRY